jgi:uncharacterized protein (TIGR03437 family)
LRLNDVEVLFGSTPAPIMAVSNIGGQESVIVQVPFEVAAPGTTSLTVRVSGGSTTISDVPVVLFNPGILERTDEQGRRYALLQRPDGSWVTPDNAARTGETLKMFVTGLGQATPALATNSTGQASQRPVATEITPGVNDAGAEFVSAAPSDVFVGVWEVSFRAPAGFQTGASRPLSIGVRGADGQTVYSQGSTIALLQ